MYIGSPCSSPNYFLNDELCPDDYLPLLSNNSFDHQDYIDNIVDEVVLKLSNNVEININRKKDMKYMIQYYKNLSPIDKFSIKHQLKIQLNSILKLQIFFKEYLNKKHSNKTSINKDNSILSYISQYWSWNWNNTKKESIHNQEESCNTLQIKTPTNSDFILVESEDLF